MTELRTSVPARAWVVTFAGMAVNLCLGILYAWSVWKSSLKGTDLHPPGTPMVDAINKGWTYLNDAQATWAYCICGATFALFMIPGGLVQDRLGPKVGVTAGGLFLAAGCILAGLMKSFLGLVLGFGLLGGIGMGLGYAAATPAAVKWFGPQRRGLIVGLVVGGYGAAAIYIAPLANWIIAEYGLSSSFIDLGIFFAVVVLIAGQLLSWPAPGYVPPAAINSNPATAARAQSLTRVDWSAAKMVKTWQFYALVLLFIASAQSGLLVIANAKIILGDTANKIPFWAEHSWLLASLGGFVNASGRVGTGLYSDRIGRSNAYLVNGLLATVCLFAMPSIMRLENVTLLLIAVNVVYWQYGGGLSLLPALTADFFGSKNLGFNYGLVFIGWGIAFFVPLFAGFIKDVTHNFDIAFYFSGGLLLSAVILSRCVKRPLAAGEDDRGPATAA